MPEPPPNATDYFLFYQWVKPLSKHLCGKISPNTVTLLGLLPAFACAWAVYSRRIGLALLFFTLRFFMDTLDGSIARTCHQQSNFGKIFDEFADVVTDVLIVIAWTAAYISTTSSALSTAFVLILVGEIVSRRWLRLTDMAHDNLFLWEVGLFSAALIGGEFKLKRSR
jgi:phosphatidylglycerophosphate synthase